MAKNRSPIIKQKNIDNSIELLARRVDKLTNDFEKMRKNIFRGGTLSREGLYPVAVKNVNIITKEGNEYSLDNDIAIIGGVVQIFHGNIVTYYDSLELEIFRARDYDSFSTNTYRGIFNQDVTGIKASDYRGISIYLYEIDCNDFILEEKDFYYQNLTYNEEKRITDFVIPLNYISNYKVPCNNDRSKWRKYNTWVGIDEIKREIPETDGKFSPFFTLRVNHLKPNHIYALYLCWHRADDTLDYSNHTAQNTPTREEGFLGYILCAGNNTKNYVSDMVDGQGLLQEIYPSDDGQVKTKFEVDKLVVRGQMSAKELLFQQSRAVNGRLLVSQTGKVKFSQRVNSTT